MALAVEEAVEILIGKLVFERAFTFRCFELFQAIVYSGANHFVSFLVFLKVRFIFEKRMFGQLVGIFLFVYADVFKKRTFGTMPGAKHYFGSGDAGSVDISVGRLFLSINFSYPVKEEFYFSNTS